MAATAATSTHVRAPTPSCPLPYADRGRALSLPDVAIQADEPDFLGGVYLVKSRAELDKALKQIPGAKGPIALQGPGGGEMVSCTDPDGLPFHLAYGIEDKQPLDPTENREHNFPLEKPRKGSFLRYTQSPAAVHKLGHYGLLVSNFKRTFDFYTSHLNLIPSDILTVEDGKIEVAAFCHIDQGPNYVDHHTFFFSENSKRHGPHHCSFEVHDIDTQFLGHQWLERSKGNYKPVWGVGRHILGSQIFDYWWQPEGFMIEHYADGDLVNDQIPTGRLPAADEALAIWGPAVPDGFLD